MQTYEDLLWDCVSGTVWFMVQADVNHTDNSSLTSLFCVLYATKLICTPGVKHGIKYKQPYFSLTNTNVLNTYCISSCRIICFLWQETNLISTFHLYFKHTTPDINFLELFKRFTSQLVSCTYNLTESSIPSFF